VLSDMLNEKGNAHVSICNSTLPWVTSKLLLAATRRRS
jgi:hypothetical protein